MTDFSPMVGQIAQTGTGILRMFRWSRGGNVAFLAQLKPVSKPSVRELLLKFYAVPIISE